PATVRMVSNSGPPLPMPMQVPPGHLVQQIVDEEGILTHVILSPYPTPPPLAMVATGVPLPINQTNDVSTTAANLILNPNQHLQPPHLHPHHHHHFHPILISPGLPPNSESLLHLNPYTTPQHPQSHSSLHSFPHPLPTPLQLIHPHFHQQFHLHTSHPHLCDGSGSTTDGCAPISMKYPIPPEVLNETHDCDTSYKCGSPCLGDSNKSSDSFCHSKQNIVIKEIPDSTTTAVINNNINGDNHPDLIDTQHDNLVSLNDLHSINSGCCNSTESLPVIDSSINDEVAKIKSSKCTDNPPDHMKTVTDVNQKAASINIAPLKSNLDCTISYNSSAVTTHNKSFTKTVNSMDDVIISSTHGDDEDDLCNDNHHDDDDDEDDHDGEINFTSCKTSFVTAESKNITDANKCEIRNHISRVEDGQVINGQLSSDYCIPTTTITTATLINNDSISYTTTHIGTPSGLNAFSPYFASYPPATFPFHRRRRGGGVGRGANESGIVSVNPTPGEAGSNKNYTGFRPHRPTSFACNKSTQNLVWNHSFANESSKSYAEYQQCKQQQDVSENGGVANHIHHYQPRPLVTSPNQFHPSHYHRGINSNVEAVVQDVDIDSEIENEIKPVTDSSLCSLPVNVLLTPGQTHSDYCSQSKCLLNSSQCYSQHSQPQQCVESYDNYFNDNIDGAEIINGEHNDFDFNTAHTNGWNTQNKIIYNLISNILSPHVSEIKTNSALIQLTFPQDLILSSVGVVSSSSPTSLETSTSVTTSVTTSTTYNSTTSPISMPNTMATSTTVITTTSAAKVLSVDSCQSSQSSLIENNNYNNSSKIINSPSKNLLSKRKPTPSTTLIKENNNKPTDLINSIINYNVNNNRELNDNMNNITSTTIINSTVPNINTSSSNDNGERYQITIDLDTLQFELHLAEKGNTPHFKCVFIGEATYISLQDLRPGTNYYVKVCCNYFGIRGEFSPITHFTTLPSKPNPPRTVQIICQTRNSLHIKWGSGTDNGSRITSYKLEYAQVITNSSELGLDKNPDPEFFEPIQVFGRSYKINQLSPSTEYLIRVAAVNQYGQSSWSPILSASTSGSPPEIPLPPFLIQADVHSLTLGWHPPTTINPEQYHLHHHHHRHHHSHIYDQINSSSYINHLNPITYTLEMDDQTMGHGFVTVFDGTGTEHCVDNLRRNTRYRFRLAATNVDGRSRWSETITLATLPDHPSPPRNLRIYGSFLQPTRLALTWDTPEDDGGIPIQAYRLEALLPYSSGNSSNVLQRTLINGSNTKLNDAANSIVNCSLEKIDQIDVMQKLICWPHVTPLKSCSSILSSINSSLSLTKSTVATTIPLPVNTTAATTTTASVTNVDYTTYDPDHACHPLNSPGQKLSDKTTFDMINQCHSHNYEMDVTNNMNDALNIIESDHNTSHTSVVASNNNSINHYPDYDVELIYPQTAWFIIYEGPEKELMIDNLLPGLYLQLRVRACCSLTNNNNNIGPSCASFSSSASSASSSSSSSSVSSGIISTSNKHHHYSTDEMINNINTKAPVLNANTTTTATSSSSINELWGLAQYPPLKIRMPPIPPSAPSSGPRVVGKPKPTSLHLCWSPPKQTGGAPILAYEVWQLTLESTCWIDDESDDNDSDLLSSHRYCSSTPTSPLDLSAVRSSCHNLEYDSNYKSFLNNGQMLRHRQLASLHRSYTDPLLNMKSLYTGNNNNENSIKMQSLINNDSSSITLGRFICSVRETECRLFGLTPGQNYAFRVRARNRAGEGLWTEWITLSTPPSLPGAPSCPPRLLPKSPWIIHIAWDPVTCMNGAKIYEYRLECRQYQSSNSMDFYDISSEKKLISNTSLENSSGLDSPEQIENDSFFQLIYAGPKLSFEITGLQPASLFAFRVCAVNSAGAGPWSPIAKCWTPSAPPDQPHGLCVRELSPESALISWILPQCNGSPITNFMIEMTRLTNLKSTYKSRHSNVKYIQIPGPYLMDHKNQPSINTNMKLPIISMPDTSYAMIQQHMQKQMIQYCLNKLRPSTTYVLRIQAVNKFGPSEYSTNIEFTTFAPLPIAPVFSQFTNLTSNSVRLEWNIIVDDNVNDKDDSDDSSVDDHSDDIFSDNKTEDNISHKNTKEPSVDRNDTNLKSNSSRVFTHQEQQQQQREKLRKQNLSGMKSRENQLIYTLQMSREPDSDWTTIYEGQSNMYKVYRLSEFTIYHFRVCAMNETGCGSYSKVQTIRTQKASPPAVRGLKILELSSDRCQLEWTPVNQLGMDPIIYLLHLLPVTSNTQQSTNLNQVYRGNQSACRITGLNPGSEYVCRVCAVRLCQPSKLLVVNNNTSYKTSGEDQHKVSPSIDSSQYQITELPGPFSAGLLFTTPRTTKDNQFDSTSLSPSVSSSVTASAKCNLFRPKNSSKHSSSSLLQILSSPFQILRNLVLRNRSPNVCNSLQHDALNSMTFSKQDHMHSNQLVAMGTSSSSLLHNNNVSDKRRSTVQCTTSSTSPSHMIITSTKNLTSKSPTSHHNSKRSSHSWFRFTDTQLACLLLILFSLATLLVAMSLQYVLNVHLKLSNPSSSSLDSLQSSSESYEFKLNMDTHKEKNG
ncbi:Fibronectin type-III domain-containing protein isoform 2, partial [Schistosoma japonicum]